MYRTARAVRIGDVVGRGRAPTFGLPAACPFATFFLAVVTQTWRKQLRNLPVRPSSRTWVHDCTAFVQGAVGAIGFAGEAGRTAGTVELFRMKFNRTKSGVVTTTPWHTEMMRLAAGPNFQCTDALKHLGVVQGSGPADSGAAMLRWHTACDRSAKVARLSGTKGSFVATAALQVCTRPVSVSRLMRP